MMRRCCLLAVAVALLAGMAAHGQAMLREGDLLFCCADTANAITAVTHGVEELPIDHVAVFHRIGGETGVPFVIEAIKPAVRLTPLDTFLCANPAVLVGRVTADCDMTASVRRCLAMVGKPYDDLFLPGDSAVYCSELVQLCYIGHDGEPVFGPIPMSFHDTSGQITRYWRDFYRRRGMTVPQGAPGSNPGELSRRPQVSIIAPLSLD